MSTHIIYLWILSIICLHYGSALPQYQHDMGTTDNPVVFNHCNRLCYKREKETNECKLDLKCLSNLTPKLLAMPPGGSITVSPCFPNCLSDKKFVEQIFLTET